jgi:membrane protein YdbS with pleckstrin-like domain
MKKQLHEGVKWFWRVQLIWALVIFSVCFASFLIPLSIESNIESGSNSFFKGLVYLGFIFVILFVIIWEIWVRMAYARWFYEFTDTNLRQERGVIWKTYSNVPYERIQNVDIRRGIVARIMGFSSVYIQTAGYSVGANGKGVSSEGYIPAVEIQEAEKIRDFIMHKVSGKKSKGL